MNTAGSIPQPRRDLIADAGDLGGDMADDADPVGTREWLDWLDAVLEPVAVVCQPYHWGDL